MENLRSFGVGIDSDNSLYTFDDNCGKSLLPSIEMIDLTIKHLKSIKTKGQEFIDLYNFKAQSEFENQIEAISSTPSIREPKSGYIYFVKKDEYVKIGRTSQTPEIRIASIKGTHPNSAVEVLHTISSIDIVADEMEFHAIFASKRISGEWFELSDEDIKMIQEIK